MRIFNASPGFGAPLTENEISNFLINSNLLIHIGTGDEKGEPNVTPTGYYLDENSNKIYIATAKDSKKVNNLRRKNITYYCVDDPNPPYKGVRGKGKAKIYEDVDHNIPIAEKLILRRMGSLENPMGKWLLSEIEKGNEIILEIAPSYYSTWDYSKKKS